MWEFKDSSKHGIGKMVLRNGTIFNGCFKKILVEKVEKVEKVNEITHQISTFMEQIVIFPSCE